MLRFLVVATALAACNGQSTPPVASSAEPAPAATTSAVASSPAATSSATAPAGTAAIGKPAPDFTLSDLDGRSHRLSDHRGKIVVLEWFNPGCPYVRQSHEHGSLRGLAERLGKHELVWLAINSGAPGKQGAGKEANEEARSLFGMKYPVLLDESGEVGKAYGATHTPHMYVIDPAGVLVYAGAIDNSRGGDLEDVPEVENYVELAVTAVAAGRPVDQPTTKAFGCTVKYAKP